MTTSVEIAEEVSESILAIIIIISGIVLLFFGGKLLKWIVFINGFLAGSLLTYAIIHNLDISQTSNIIRYSIFIAISVGIFIGVLAICFYKLAIFMTGAICGIIIGQLLWYLITLLIDMSKYTNQTNNIIHILLIIIFAILFGLLTLKYLIKAITSFVGSFMVTSGIAYYIQRYSIEDFNQFNDFKNTNDNVMDITQYFSTHNQCDLYCWIFVCVWIILFIIGVTYQYKWYKCYKSGTKNSNHKHVKVNSFEHIQIIKV
eukprot:94388_1